MSGRGRGPADHPCVWEATDTVPACWPQRPHLVHEIAVLADQRRRAGHAFTSDALEEWHRYSLPAFTERMKSRLRNHCEDGHQPWPAKGRHTRYTAEINRGTLAEHYASARRCSESYRGEGSPASTAGAG